MGGPFIDPATRLVHDAMNMWFSFGVGSDMHICENPAEVNSAVKLLCDGPEHIL